MQNTKQQAYTARMNDMGFTSIKVAIHPDDKEKIRELARKLRKKRGYKGQPKNG